MAYLLLGARHFSIGMPVTVAAETAWEGLHPIRDLFVGVPTPFLLRPLTLQGLGDEESDDNV